MCSSADLVRRVDVAVRDSLTSLDDPSTDVGSGLAADYLALRALTDQLEVLALSWLAVLDRSGIGTTDGSASSAAWVRRHTSCSGRSASADVRLARRLHTDPLRSMGTTSALLETGRLTVEHARVIARATATLTAAAHDAAEPAIAAAATTLGVDATGQVAAAVAEHAAELHAAGCDDPAAARRAAAEAGRRLHLTRVGEHYALDALLTVEVGESLRAVLEPLSVPRPAAADGPDLRTAPQRRADALADAARRLLAGGELPMHGGQRPQLTVLIDVERLTASGRSRHRGGGRFSDGGRLSAAATRRLSCDPTLSWVALASGGETCPHPAANPDATCDADTDASSDCDVNDAERVLIRRALQQVSPALGGIPSQILDAGRTQRLVTSAQRRALTLRDRGCVFPGCDRPPGWCDAHHVIHWADGGATDLDNLALICSRHHVAVHDDGWGLARGPDGTVTAHPPPRY